MTTGIFPNPYYNGIRMTISSGVLDKTKGAYLAAMMGGVYNSATGTFKSVYDYEDDFFAYSDHKALYFLMQKKFGTDTTSKYILPGITSVSAYSENCPRMTLDDYIYIRGAPESSIWNTDGTSSDIAAILPRNRLLNQSVSTEAAFLTASTHIIKSSLNSMRVMKLYITDKDGN